MNRLIVSLLFLLLAGCLSAPPLPEDRFYRLQPEPVGEVLPRPRLTGGLALEDVDADPLHRGRAMLYCEPDRPLQLRRYHYEFWEDQPPRMVQRSLTAWLRQAGVADQVLESRAGDPAWRLRARLLRFEEVRQAGGAARVEVALSVSLYSGAARRPVWARDYARQEPVDGTSMYAVAQAMQTALASLYTQLQADLVAPAR